MNLTTKFLNSIANSTRFMLNGEGGIPVLTQGGDSSFIAKVWAIIEGGLLDIVNFIITVVIKLCLLIGRFILNIVDFFFVLTRQLLGLNSKFDDLEDLGGDVILKFVTNKTVLEIIKQMLIIGIVLIIVFSIIAILRAEYGNVSGADTSKKHILVNALKSCFLMIIIPLVCVMSLVFSNAILASLYNATAGGDDISVGTFIWKSSTYHANAYRDYANLDNKIPITYNFYHEDEEDFYVNYDKINTDGTNNDLENALVEYLKQNENSSFKSAFSTWFMFESNQFVSISGVEQSEKEITDPEMHSAYYGLYDNNLYFKRAEYYVMADAIDHCLDINDDVENGFFFMSINDVYENHCQAYGVTTITSLPIEKCVKNGVNGYKTTVRYLGDDTETEYFSPINTNDESDGTVYTLCYSEKIKVAGSDVETEIYRPFIQHDIMGFNSSYITSPGSLVIARGVFDNNSQPTAIRKNENGEIQFYRDNIYSPTLLDFFPTISYEKPDGQKELAVSKFLRYGVERITGLDTDELIPKIYINFDLMALFTKAEKNVAHISENSFTVDFNMSDTSLATENLYCVSKINPFILLIGGVVLLEVLFYIVFGLIGRIFDCVLLAITYPGVVSTMPLAGSSMIGEWVDTFINRLVCVYGIVIVLNFSLLIMPVISGIEVFTKADIDRIMTTSILPLGWTSTYLNLLVGLMFILVGFSLIKRLSIYMNFMLSRQTLKEAQDKFKKAKKQDKSLKDFEQFVEKNDDGIQSAGESIWNQTQQVVATAGAVISGQVIFTAAKDALGRLADYIPGAPVVTLIKERKASKRNKLSMKNNKQMRKNLINTANSGALNSVDGISDAVSKLNKQTAMFKKGKK